MLERLFGGGSSHGRVPSVNPREAWERLSTERPGPVLIDVRESWEYARGHAKGAKNIPLSTLRKRIGEVPRTRSVYVICQSGHRSMSAAQLLLEEGIAQVTNVSGGTTIWQAHQLPMENGRG